MQTAKCGVFIVDPDDYLLENPIACDFRYSTVKNNYVNHCDY